MSTGQRSNGAKRSFTKSKQAKETAHKKEIAVRNREEGLCPASKRCGGCTMIHVPYPVQLEKKQRRV